MAKDLSELPRDLALLGMECLVNGNFGQPLTYGTRKVSAILLEDGVTVERYDNEYFYVVDQNRLQWLCPMSTVNCEPERVRELIASYPLTLH